ncbi:M48 family metalloprotease [Rhodobium gokarnense]|uniref:Heat shock protein HtpX n=1 Tax=Rhodobium gokarnense TaxID=364296 RepID=A0ABT3HAF8_9HYPH|nr:M48 family metalloprotease [Rhodobium gokarnense]MCW2307383.1 heat shock protein HtpX [Rhodobium gokarnense]
MATLDPARLRNPVWPTVTIMVIGAIIGVFIGTAFALTTGMFAAGFAGPLAFLMFGPLVLAEAGAGLALALVAAPTWAGFGGWHFGAKAATPGVAATTLGVTLFSEGHPIHQYINKKAEELSLPPIKWVGWFDDEAINAFAMGTTQENALLAFSRGAIQKLTMPQLDAVMAHELAHVANNDMARMTYAYGAQNALTWFLYFRGLKNIARWLFTPTSQIEIMRFSRQREFWADAVAAVLTNPEQIIGALDAIQNDVAKPPKQQRAFASFMLRANLNNLFASHPPISDRIQAIEDGRYIKRLPYLNADAAQGAPTTAPVGAAMPAPVRASER